ncbi:hypothetical protein HDE_08697 [Halotydeus destructor]|nr:hypothetical protein HDE_08697 [Halotydeus destructor]
MARKKGCSPKRSPRSPRSARQLSPSKVTTGYCWRFIKGHRVKVHHSIKLQDLRKIGYEVVKIPRLTSNQLDDYFAKSGRSYKEVLDHVWVELDKHKQDEEGSVPEYVYSEEPVMSPGSSSRVKTKAELKLVPVELQEICEKRQPRKRQPKKELFSELDDVRLRFECLQEVEPIEAKSEEVEPKSGVAEELDLEDIEPSKAVYVNEPAIDHEVNELETEGTEIVKHLVGEVEMSPKDAAVESEKPEIDILKPEVVAGISRKPKGRKRKTPPKLKELQQVDKPHEPLKGIEISQFQVAATSEQVNTAPGDKTLEEKNESEAPFYMGVIGSVEDTAEPKKNVKRRRTPKGRGTKIPRLPKVMGRRSVSSNVESADIEETCETVTALTDCDLYKDGDVIAQQLTGLDKTDFLLSKYCFHKEIKVVVEKLDINEFELNKWKYHVQIVTHQKSLPVEAPLNMTFSDSETEDQHNTVNDIIGLTMDLQGNANPTYSCAVNDVLETLNFDIDGRCVNMDVAMGLEHAEEERPSSRNVKTFYDLDEDTEVESNIDEEQDISDLLNFDSDKLKVNFPDLVNAANVETNHEFDYLPNGPAADFVGHCLEDSIANAVQEEANLEPTEGIKSVESSKEQLDLNEMDGDNSVQADVVEQSTQVEESDVFGYNDDTEDETEIADDDSSSNTIAEDSFMPVNETREGDADCANKQGQRMVTPEVPMVDHLLDLDITPSKVASDENVSDMISEHINTLKALCGAETPVPIRDYGPFSQDSSQHLIDTAKSDPAHFWPTKYAQIQVPSLSRSFPASEEQPTTPPVASQNIAVCNVEEHPVNLSHDRNISHVPANVSSQPVAVSLPVRESAYVVQNISPLKQRIRRYHSHQAADKRAEACENVVAPPCQVPVLPQAVPVIQNQKQHVQRLQVEVNPSLRQSIQRPQVVVNQVAKPQTQLAPTHGTQSPNQHQVQAPLAAQRSSTPQASYIGNSSIQAYQTPQIMTNFGMYANPAFRVYNMNSSQQAQSVPTYFHQNQQHSFPVAQNRVVQSQQSPLGYPSHNQGHMFMNQAITNIYPVLAQNPLNTVMQPHMNVQPLVQQPQVWSNQRNTESVPLAPDYPYGQAVPDSNQHSNQFNPCSYSGQY